MKDKIVISLDSTIGIREFMEHYLEVDYIYFGLSLKRLSKIEEQLDYPGIIRITALRETKLVQYLR